MDREPFFLPRVEPKRSGKRWVILSTICGGQMKVSFALIPIPHWSGPFEPVIAKTFKTYQEAEAAIAHYKLESRANEPVWIQEIDYDRKEKIRG